MARVRSRHEKSIFSLIFFKLLPSAVTEKIPVKTAPEKWHSPESRPERALEDSNKKTGEVRA